MCQNMAQLEVDKAALETKATFESSQVKQLEAKVSEL